MITFVWTPSTMVPPLPLVPMHGGAETYTLGQCRELARRGIGNRIVTFGMGAADGREHAPDVAFVDLSDPADLAELDRSSVLIHEPLRLPAVAAPFQLLHSMPHPLTTRQQNRAGLDGRCLIVTSRASARGWAEYLHVPADTIGVVHPFAATIFGAEPVPARPAGPTRVLFAGRLSVEKGIHTFLEALHHFVGRAFEFTVLLAGGRGDEYPLIEPLVRAHPMVRLRSELLPHELAALLVTQDVLVMPGHPHVRPEAFGMLSVEAQHAGCRVVAGDLGGMPETDCGGLLLFRAGDPLALAHAIRRAGRQGRLTDAERRQAAQRFTPSQSVDQLLSVLAGDRPAFAA